MAEKYILLGSFWEKFVGEHWHGRQDPEHEISVPSLSNQPE